MKQSILRTIILIIGFFLIGWGLPSMASRLGIDNCDFPNRQEALLTRDCTSFSAHGGVLLPEGTRITLQLFEDVSSQDQTAGRLVQWGVYKDVRVSGNNDILIKAGAFAAGKVTFARRSGVFGRPGRIALNVSTVDAVDGQRIPVYCSPIDEQGKDRRALAWCMSIGLTIVGLVIIGLKNTGEDAKNTNGALYLVAVLPMFSGLAISGKDVTIPGKSTLIEVTVQHDMMINA